MQIKLEEEAANALTRLVRLSEGRSRNEVITEALQGWADLYGSTSEAGGVAIVQTTLLEVDQGKFLRLKTQD